jgi:hypothetical protein
MRVHSLSGDFAARALLPGRDRELRVVLFWRAGHPESEAALSRLERAEDGRLEVHAVELCTSPQVASWFSIRQVPALAAIADGALLAIEYECSGDAAECVADLGARTLGTAAAW